MAVLREWIRGFGGSLEEGGEGMASVLHPADPSEVQVSRCLLHVDADFNKRD